MYGEINENNTPINFLNFKTKGGVGYKNTDTGIKTELGIEKKLDNINDPTLYTNFNIDKEKYNIGINANLPFNENQIKPIIMGNASFRPNKKTNITLEGGYDFNTNQPNFKAGVTRKFRNGGVAGDPPKKPKRIKIEKSNWEGKGLSHPTTTQGYNQLMTKAYEGLKKDEQYQVKCSGNEQCAGQNNLLLKNMKNSLSNELGYKTEYKRKRRDAWNFPDNSYEVLYTNSYYKPQIESKLKGNKKALSYKKMLPEKSLFTPVKEGEIDRLEGALVVGDRANTENSHIWATQYKKPGS